MTEYDAWSGAQMNGKPLGEMQKMEHGVYSTRILGVSH